VDQPSLFAAPGPVSAAVANIDGGSRGNPGPAGYGVRIQPEGADAIDLKESLGICTNNVAEYSALLAALRWAVANGCKALHVRSDSLLLVQQMKGVYKVKHAGLQPLCEEARRLAKQIGLVTYEHVRREFNKDADRLANEAMDEAAAAAPPTAI
jgi:probable phosphoglycerate mutase